MLDQLVTECLHEYARSQNDTLKRDIILEAIRLDKESPDELIPRVATAVGSSRSTVCKVLREASKYKRVQLPPKIIAEAMDDS